MPNFYCQAAGIEPPQLAGVKDHREAGPFSLLLVALLENGGPLTLEQAAERFADAGVAPYDRALLSLKRCRPGRPPVHRDGDVYALDPHDDELDFWLFRLGLRPPHVPQLQVVRPDPGPRPDPLTPLAPEEIAEAFHAQNLHGWSAQRLAIAVLDAHGPRMPAERVEEILDGLTTDHHSLAATAGYWRSAPIAIEEGGWWTLDREHKVVRPARDAVRDQIARVRRQKENHVDPVSIAARMRAADRRREARAEQLARQRRILVHGYPAEDPAVVVLLDITFRKLQTYPADHLAEARDILSGYDHIAGLGVRALLKGIGFEPEDRRLAELGPPQKTVKVSSTRTIKVTPELMIQGSCRISRPLGDPKTLDRYLAEGKLGRLARRLEADAKSLYAYYNYGMLHHHVLMNWGFLEMPFRAPWVNPEEPSVFSIMEEAFFTGRDLEIVVGSAPGWKDPWARGRRCEVLGPGGEYVLGGMILVDEDGRAVFNDEVQAIRFWIDGDGE